MFVKPRTAWVGRPAELLSGGRAWKARYTEALPSTRTRRGPSDIRATRTEDNVKPTTDNRQRTTREDLTGFSLSVVGFALVRSVSHFSFVLSAVPYVAGTGGSRTRTVAP